MAYVLGLMFSDGSLENSPKMRGKYLRFTTTDKELVELVRAALDSAHTIVTYKRSDRHKRGYMIRVGNQHLFNRLVELGVTPRKSLTMPFPVLDNAYLADFVRGYFDGDGCVYVERKSGKIKRLSSIFTSGSLPFLESLEDRLSSTIGTVPKKIYRHGSTAGAYQLRYSTRDSLRLYQLMYDASKPALCLERKWVIFETFLRNHGLSQAAILEELSRSGPMVKRKHGGLQNHYARVRFSLGPPVR